MENFIGRTPSFSSTRDQTPPTLIRIENYDEVFLPHRPEPGLPSTSLNETNKRPPPGYSVQFIIICGFWPAQRLILPFPWMRVGGRGIPHVADLGDGEWYHSTEEDRTFVVTPLRVLTWCGLCNRAPIVNHPCAADLSFGIQYYLPGSCSRSKSRWFHQSKGCFRILSLPQKTLRGFGPQLKNLPGVKYSWHLSNS